MDDNDKEVDEIKKSWPEIYDTLMIGKIKSKTNSEFLNKYPIIITKSREQNIFISRELLYLPKNKDFNNKIKIKIGLLKKI